MKALKMLICEALNQKQLVEEALKRDIDGPAPEIPLTGNKKLDYLFHGKRKPKKKGPPITSAVFFPQTQVETLLDETRFYEGPTGAIGQWRAAALDEARDNGIAGPVGTAARELVEAQKALLQDARDAAQEKRRLSDDVLDRHDDAIEGLEPWAAMEPKKPKGKRSKWYCKCGKQAHVIDSRPSHIAK